MRSTTRVLWLTIITLMAVLLACSSTETSSSPTAVAQTQAPAPAAASITAPTTAPVEAPEQVESPTTAPVEIPAPTTAPVEIPAPTTAPVEITAPTDAPPKITPESRMPGPAGMDGTGSLISQLSDNEQSCLSENGDPQQLLTLINSPELASPEERKVLAECLENETLLNIFLKGFTDQAGPLSSDTSACIGAGFQNLDLSAMMLTSPEEPEEEAGVVQVMAGLMIVLACLDEPEWQAASQRIGLAPDGREALQCVMNLLGGPEGIVASLESKEGEPPIAFLNAATECGLTMMGRTIGPQH